MTILLEELNAKGKCTLPIGTVRTGSAGRQLGHSLPRWLCLCCSQQLPACLCLELGVSEPALPYLAPRDGWDGVMGCKHLVLCDIVVSWD